MPSATTKVSATVGAVCLALGASGGHLIAREPAPPAVVSDTATKDSLIRLDERAKATAEQLLSIQSQLAVLANVDNLYERIDRRIRATVKSEALR